MQGPSPMSVNFSRCIFSRVESPSSSLWVSLEFDIFLSLFHFQMLWKFSSASFDRKTRSVYFAGDLPLGNSDFLSGVVWWIPVSEGNNHSEELHAAIMPKKYAFYCSSFPWNQDPKITCIVSQPVPQPV